MKYTAALILFLLSSLIASSQKNTPQITGNYADPGGFTKLQLHPDNTFTLNTSDEVLTYTFRQYQTTGSWTRSGDTVWLNPGKEKRTPSVHIIEKTIEKSDSLTIKINYIQETYRNDSLIARQPADFKMMTISVNANHNYKNVVHQRIRTICTFSPRIKQQIVVDSSNTFHIAKENLHWIAVNSYGFGGPIKLPISNPTANYLEVDVVLPMQEDRSPCNKVVLVKGNRLFYYEYKGKIMTSPFIAHPLVKKA
jgi:hypothetical protein